MTAAVAQIWPPQSKRNTGKTFALVRLLIDDDGVIPDNGDSKKYIYLNESGKVRGGGSGFYKAELIRISDSKRRGVGEPEPAVSHR